jgi:dihydroorotase
MIAEARQRGLPVTAGVAIHQLLCSENDIGAFNTLYKVIPPLRTEQDKNGLIAGVVEGNIAVICSDHQPHGTDAKLVPFSEAAIGIAGIDTLLSLSLSLVAQGRLTLDHVIAALTINPAQIIGIDAGHLSPGVEADLCLFDANRNWQLNDQSMKSNGRNSPFMGMQLTGKVTRTILRGKTVFSE